MANDLLNVVRYGWENLSTEEGATGNGSVNAGHLLETNGDGDFIPHGTDGGDVNRLLIAKDMRGRGYEVLDNYPSAEWIEAVVPNAGVGVTLELAAGSDLATAANATITEGDLLVSAGDGTVRLYDAANDDENAVVAAAEEANDNSGAAAGETARLDAEVVR